VHLVGDNREILPDASQIFLIPKAEVADASDCCDNLRDRVLTGELVGQLFGQAD
jgi:hypothetical protein